MIDGSGEHWWLWSERASRNALKDGKPARITFRRPHLIVIDTCLRLREADVTLTNSSMFHFVPRSIDDITVERVMVRSPWDGSAPNTDDIDPGPGRNFWIHHCDIDTGDDDIVIKSGGTNILIEDNPIGHGHGISIGSETTVGVHHMLVRNCTFDGTDIGLRIKSIRGAGGIVEDVRYENIRMRNVEKAFVLRLDYANKTARTSKAIRLKFRCFATLPSSTSPSTTPAKPVRSTELRKARSSASPFGTSN